MRVFLSILFLCITISVYAQKENTYTCNFQNASLQNALSDLEKHFEIRFSYESKLIENVQISLQEKDKKLEEIISILEEKTILDFKILSNKYIVIQRKTQKSLIKGYVFSNYKKPISGAIISIGKKNTITNTKGYFEISHIPEADLRLKHLSYESKIISFEKIENKEIHTFVLEDKINILPSIFISNFLTKGIKKTNNSFVIRPGKLGIIPGLTEPDILQSLQLLPSVKSPNESATKLYVRGGTPDQNLILWDGIQMFHTGHLFGMVSAFNPYITKKVTFMNKGTSAQYGERISSTILMESDTRVPTKISGEVGINMINVDASIKIPIIKNKLGIILATRSSIADFYQSITLKNIAKKTFENTRIHYTDEDFETFKFNDYNVKLIWNLSPKHRFNFSYIHLNNELDYLNTSTENEIFQDYLFTRNYGYSFRAKNRWTDKFSTETTAFLSRYKLIYNYGIYEGSKENMKENYAKRNSISDFGVKVLTNYDFAKYNRIQFGAEVDYKNVGYDFKGESVNYVLNLDASKEENKTYASFVEYSFKNPNIFYLNIGLRTNYFSILKENKIEPRIVITKPFGKFWKFSVSTEIKHQVISQIRETAFNNFVLENQLWTLSSEDKFPLIKSTQNTGSLTYFKDNWYFNVEFYHKRVKGITTKTLGFLNPYDNEYHTGNSTINGIDFFAQKTISDFKTSLSYSYLKNKTFFQNLNDNKDFFANTDIKHAIKWSGIYQWKKFQFALLWTWHTGKPYTEVYNANTSQKGAPEIFYEEINNKRLPNYSRVDFSSTYQFNFTKKIKSKIGISFLNILNTKNYINREYKVNSTLVNELVVIDRKGLLFTPNILFRVMF
ncbi:FecR domain-containing protein [Aureivirga marina]|uniref:FecR domain-containing protein n=1 Tax=Aureivirga marina TaxID=1182451 RepID=UPI0018CA5FB1|nr:FecR domain-containing protein [Aureivirga marina]